jgi:hypothetical protein
LAVVVVSGKRASNEDEDGRIWECVQCHEQTGDPFAHRRDAHDGRVLAYDDFNLIRGALHKTTGPRKPHDTERYLPLFEMEGLA